MQGYRSDIGKYCETIEEANIERIIKYEKEKNNTELTSSEFDYEQVKDIYKKLIPLFEDEKTNAKKYPDLYDDKKWIVGKREKKRVHNKLLIMDNGFKFKIGFLWKHQPFEQRPTYKVGINNKFVKTFRAKDINNNIICENENWGAILAMTQQYIKDNAKEYYNNYLNNITIEGHCKSEDKWFEIVIFDVLKNKWLI